MTLLFDLSVVGKLNCKNLVINELSFCFLEESLPRNYLSWIIKELGSLGARHFRGNVSCSKKDSKSLKLGPNVRLNRI